MKGLAGLAVALVLVRGGRTARVLAGCTIFPPDNPWNRRVDSLPVRRELRRDHRADRPRAPACTPTSAPACGTGARSGSRTRSSPATQPKMRVSFDYADESDPGPYPIPPAVKIEGGGDRHALIVDRDTCRLYELYALRRTRRAGTPARARSGTCARTALRPAGWTSADAAGLPILPGLARYDEVAAGRSTTRCASPSQRTRRAYVYPARHYASELTDAEPAADGPAAAAAGDFDTSRFPRQARVSSRR